VEALLSDPNREIICVTLMKFNAKAKSFHVAVRGNFPAARDSAKPDTYTTTRRRAVGNRSSSEDSSTSSAESSPESAKHHRNHQSESSIINGPPTGHPDIESTTIPASDPSSEALPWNRERSVERVVATEPQTIRRVSRRHGTANEPPQRYSQAIRPPPGLRRRTAYVAYTVSNDE